MTRNVFGDCCMTKKSSSKRGQKQDTVTESNIHLTWHPTLTQFYHCHPKKAVKIACRTTSRCTILFHGVLQKLKNVRFQVKVV